MAAEIEESLRTLLKTFDAVTALLGGATNPRIRPDRLDEGDTLPAIIIEVDDEEQLNDLSGVGGLVRADVNVKCRAATKKGARLLAWAVRTNNTDPGTGLAGYSGEAGDQTIHAVLDDETPSYTPAGDGRDDGHYDVDMDFTIMFNETT